METKLEGIAAKARKEANLKFTSLCHHITRELIWSSLCKTPLKSAPGIDGMTVKMAKEGFNEWIDKMLQSIHRKGYKAPAVRRVWIPKPGKKAKRPLGVPAIADRALQRSTATVLSEWNQRRKNRPKTPFKNQPLMTMDAPVRHWCEPKIKKSCRG